MKPTFSEDGELLGLQIRTELILTMFYKNNFNTNILKRAIKTICMVNRLIQQGQDYDFELKGGDESSTLII